MNLTNFYNYADKASIDDINDMLYGSWRVEQMMCDTSHRIYLNFYDALQKVDARQMKKDLEDIWIKHPVRGVRVKLSSCLDDLTKSHKFSDEVDHKQLAKFEVIAYAIVDNFYYSCDDKLPTLSKYWKIKYDHSLREDMKTVIELRNYYQAVEKMKTITYNLRNVCHLAKSR